MNPQPVIKPMTTEVDDLVKENKKDLRKFAIKMAAIVGVSVVFHVGIHVIAKALQAEEAETPN